LQGIEQFMQQEGLKDITELISVARC